MAGGSSSRPLQVPEGSSSEYDDSQDKEWERLGVIPERRQQNGHNEGGLPKELVHRTLLDQSRELLKREETNVEELARALEQEKKKVLELAKCVNEVTASHEQKDDKLQTLQTEMEESETQQTELMASLQKEIQQNSQMQEQVKVLQGKNKGVDDLHRVIEQLSRENKGLKDAVSFELQYEEAMSENAELKTALADMSDSEELKSEIAELKTELADTHMELSRMRKQLKRAQSESATLGHLSPHLDKKPRIN